VADDDRPDAGCAACRRAEAEHGAERVDGPAARGRHEACRLSGPWVADVEHGPAEGRVLAGAGERGDDRRVGDEDEPRLLLPLTQREGPA
jgi:hypothetical protein